MTRGRPRQFDPDAALDAAMRLFWHHGYEGTSLAALAAAMGINMPSLYAAFGNKQSLFTKVVDRYIQKPASYLHKAIAAPTAREVAEQALSGAIDMIMQPGSADGCLLVHGALASGPTAASVRAQLNARRARAEQAVCERFERAKQQGDLPPQSDPQQLARYLMTMIWGMSVQAAGGAGRDELQSIADQFMRAWPS